ncbi:MAG: hypothetical protein M5R42_14960 [Rhodocyclaceae bacterium]|nr:hypothetical protein [Rhodocyclaceae bacterium]
MDANRTLWQAVQTGYLHCLAACLEGNADVRAHAPMVAQRALSALRAELLDIYRAPIDPPASLWQTLHRVFTAAEQLNALAQPVNDSLQPEHPATGVVAAYAQTLLLHRASPYELSGRQLLQIERWLHRWGGKVSILNAPPVEPRVPPLLVDLSARCPRERGGGEATALAGSVGAVAQREAPHRPPATRRFAGLARPGRGLCATRLRESAEACLPAMVQGRGGAPAPAPRRQRHLPPWSRASKPSTTIWPGRSSASPARATPSPRPGLTKLPLSAVSPPGTRTTSARCMAS